MEIVPGIDTLPQTINPITVPREESTITPLVVEVRNGLLLVDTTYPGEFDQLVNSLADIGRDIEELTGLILTHQDIDHAGATATAIDRTDVTVYAHEQCAPYVDGRRPLVKQVRESRYPPAEVDVELVDGVSFTTVAGPMEVVHSPGHSPGHISLYVPNEKLLVTGDAMAAPDGILEGPHEDYTPDMKAAWASVERLARLEIDRTLCHHGGLVEAGSERIQDLVETVDRE